MILRNNCFSETKLELFDSLSIYLDTCYYFEMEPKLFTCLSVIHFDTDNFPEMEPKLFSYLL